MTGFGWKMPEVRLASWILAPWIRGPAQARSVFPFFKSYILYDICKSCHNDESGNALWFNRGMGSEMGVAQLLALKVFPSTTLEF